MKKTVPMENLSTSWKVFSLRCLHLCSKESLNAEMQLLQDKLNQIEQAKGIPVKSC